MAKGSTHWFLKALLLLLFIQLRNAEKQKRQIFREQVSPSRGGKIPEEAFRADRLALNRLNKAGITIPDGVILDARHVHKHPNTPSKMPEVLKVFLAREDRYVPPEGRYNYERPRAVDTTYLAQHPLDSKIGSVKFGGGYGDPGVPLPAEPQIFQPLSVPRIIRTRDEEPFKRNSYYSSWTPSYAWRIIYEPTLNDYFVRTVALFDTRRLCGASNKYGTNNRFY